MLGRRSAQLSCADMDQWWKRIPPTSRWAQIRHWRETHWPDEAFAAWYHHGGRPSIPPSCLATLPVGMKRAQIILSSSTRRL